MELIGQLEKGQSFEGTVKRPLWGTLSAPVKLSWHRRNNSRHNKNGAIESCASQVQVFKGRATPAVSEKGHRELEIFSEI